MHLAVRRGNAGLRHQFLNFQFQFIQGLNIVI